MDASAHERNRVLNFASNLCTTPDNPTAVLIQASPLLAWLEAATTEDDLQARMNALSQTFQNRCKSYRPADDNPDLFVKEAKQYHAFLTAGTAS